ncbi:MAG: MFS transporter [Bacilli bacterium]|jgi:MFS family permease
MKLDTKKTILVGFAFLAISMFWVVYDSIIAKLLINSFGLNQLWSGVLMALDNMLALFLLPLFGLWSDRTKSKYGKRTPYIFIGTVIAAIVIVGVGIIDHYQLVAVEAAGIGPIIESIGGGFTFDGASMIYDTKELATVARRELVFANVTSADPTLLVVFIGVLLLVLIAMASYRTPAVSLMPDVTPKPLRSKANAIINLMGTVGGMISLGFMTFLAKDYQSYIPAFVLLAALMIVFLVIFMMTVKEVKWVKENNELMLKQGLIDAKEAEEIVEGKDEKMPKDVRKSFLLILASVVLWFFAYNAATSKFSVYATDVLNTGFTLPLLFANVTALAAFIPVGIIATKIGRKKTILIGISILIVAFLLASFLNEDSAILIWVTMALAGIGWATINVNSYPMIVEMSKGSNIGKYTGYYYTASMAAQIFTPIISGALMDVMGMWILFPYSTVFIVGAFFTMFFVKHGDSKPAKQDKLEALAGADD